MSRDIETLLRETAQTARPIPGLAAPSDLRRRGERRRATRRGGTAVVIVVLVGGITLGLGSLVGTSSTPPTRPGVANTTVTGVASASTVLPDFPVAPSLHGSDPSVPRTTGTGPGSVTVNLSGTTTTYFACLGGGQFKQTVEGVPDVGHGATWMSGMCSGDVDGSTLTHATGAAHAVIHITVDPGVTWAIQVVPGSASMPGGSQAPPSPPGISASPTPTVAASRPCTGSDLQVTLTGGDGAGGSAQAVLVFRNVGTLACWLRGYPTVTAEEANQHSTRTATDTLSTLWGGTAVVSTVSVAPGQAASATLQWGDNPGGNVTTCQSHPLLAVTAPGTTEVTRLQTANFVSMCTGLEVLPVVGGTRGTVLAA